VKDRAIVRSDGQASNSLLRIPREKAITEAKAKDPHLLTAADVGMDMIPHRM
jgi:hypothetical protein